MSKYDIVDYSFTYKDDVLKYPTDSTKWRSKIRPVLVLEDDIVVPIVKISSKIDKHNTPTDYNIEDWESAGLKEPSVIVFGDQLVVTVSSLGIKRGHLTETDIKSFERKMHLKSINESKLAEAKFKVPGGKVIEAEDEIDADHKAMEDEETAKIMMDIDKREGKGVSIDYIERVDESKLSGSNRSLDIKEVIPLVGFKKACEEIGLSNEEINKIKLEIISNPLGGDVIPGGNGARKLRVAIESNNKGKSHGARVIYVNFFVKQKAYLLDVYAKSEKEDLSPSEIRMISNIIDILGK